MSRERKKKLEISLAAFIQQTKASRATSARNKNDAPSGAEVAWERFIAGWKWDHALEHAVSERTPDVRQSETPHCMVTAAWTPLDEDAGRLESTLYAVLQGLNVLLDYPPDALHGQLTELAQLRDDLISLEA